MISYEIPCRISCGIRYDKALTFFLGALLALGVLAGCGDSGLKNEDEILIRVGDSVTTVLEFNKAFEIAKVAYPHNTVQNPVAYREIQLRVLNQITEEMLVLQRAKELNIEISDSEIEKAVAAIKSDYPGDTFEQALLENAISYRSWEKRLKIRLLIDKVVSKELEEAISITPADISKYYEEHYRGENLSDTKEGATDPTEVIVRQLRRQKAEESYKPWIKELQKKYPIEINQTELKKILGS